MEIDTEQGLEIKKSKIAGNGVFANKEIKKGSDNLFP